MYSQLGAPLAKLGKVRLPSESKSDLRCLQQLLELMITKLVWAIASLLQRAEWRKFSTQPQSILSLITTTPWYASLSDPWLEASYWPWLLSMSRGLPYGID